MRQSAALIAQAMGAKVEVPDTETEVAAFDAALLDDVSDEPADQVSTEHAELLAALGVPARPFRR